MSPRRTRAPRVRALAIPRVLAGRVALIALVLGGVWIAFAAASDHLIVDTASADEPGWVAGVLGGLAPGLTDTGFSIALLAMLGGYAVALACAREVAPREALAAIALVALALALAPPLLSSDVFGYIGYGRLGAIHHINPYTLGVDAAPGDPVFGLVYWQHPTSPYGPLFTLGTYALAARSLPVELWALKVLALVGFAASLALVCRCARLMDREPRRALLALGANPLLLVYGLAGAHNDMLVLAGALGALALLAGSRPGAAGAAFATVTAVKATGGLLLPFALIGRADRWRILGGALAAAVPLLAVTFAVFGTHVLDSLGQIATGSSFDIAYSGPDLLGRLLGTGVDTDVRLAAGAGALLAMGLSLRALRRGMDWLDAAGWTVLALLCAIASFVPWYLAWLLPATALSRSRALACASLLFTAAVVVTHLPLLGFPSAQ